MKSIRTKIVILVFIVIIFCAGVIGGAGMFYAQSMAEENSVQIMNLLAEETGMKLDRSFFSIEQSVKIISHQVVTRQDMLRIYEDDALRGEYIDNLEGRILEIAESTEGAVAVYWHLNPQVAPPDEGIFYSRNSLEEEFVAQPVTDLSKEQPANNPTSWYYVPAEEGRAVWLEPYYNGKTKEQVGSYVMPVYQNGVLLGVVGIDFLLHNITETIDNIQLYESGCAYLINRNNELIYHPSGAETFPLNGNMEEWKAYLAEIEREQDNHQLYKHYYNGEEYKTTYCNLENRLRLVITVPVSEIDEVKNDMQRAMLGGVSLVAMFCLTIGIWLSQGIVQPLKKIIATSKLIADGDLTVRLPLEAKDEVGELAANLQRTVDRLRIYVNEMSELAYRDALTGVKSKTAYAEEIQKIEDNIQMGLTQIGILVFDVNNLKIINDTYGHEVGNEYIIGAANLICDCFKRSPIYRVGGDEFVAVLRGQDLIKASTLLQDFYIKMRIVADKTEEHQPKISVAVGYAFFNREKDTSYHDVFNRADKSMYENKKLMKAGKEPKLPK